MKNVSTGFGLCVLGLGIAAWPVLDRLMPQANAVGVGSIAPAVATAALAQDPPAPTVVWMGLTSSTWQDHTYHRLWSDGRMEIRSVSWRIDAVGGACGYFASPLGAKCYDSGWIEVSPPPGGNGFACRADLDGNRTVDGADLGMILANWGQQPPCEPEATFPCMTIPGGTLAPLVP
jgi:hypothetical protein